MTTPTAKPAVTRPAIDLPELWNLTVGWLDAHWLQIVIAGVAGTLIYLALGGLKHLGARMKAKEGDASSLIGVFARTIDRTTHFFMIMVAARLVAGYANPPQLLLQTVQFLFTVAAVFQGAIWARELILGFIERRSGGASHETLQNAMGIIRLLVSVALFAIATVVVLDNLGVNVTGLVAGLGIGGIAIGLAAQGIFSDLFAALSIIFDQPFRRGETIAYDTTTATVDHIGLKSTRLRAVTGEKKIISNANLLQKEITSFQTLDHRRIKFPIGVIYQTPPDKADRIPGILKEIIEAQGGVFVRSGFVGFGASSLDFEVEFDVYRPDWDQIYRIRHATGLAILRRFTDEGLEFAYPTQTTFTAAPDGRMIMPYDEARGEAG